MEDLHNSENAKAVKAASELVSRRMYTCREISDKLKKKGLSEETVSAGLETFIQNGIINDRDYAEVYITNEVLVNHKGSFRIRRELMQKGVARSIIDAAFDKSELDFEDALFEYLGVRLRGGEIGGAAEKEKLKQHLARRGYSLSEIRHGIERYEAEHE